MRADNNHTRWKHKWESRMCVGQDCFGMGWDRTLEQRKTKVSSIDGQQGLRDLSQTGRKSQNKPSNEKNIAEFREPCVSEGGHLLPAPVIGHPYRGPKRKGHFG